MRTSVILFATDLVDEGFMRGGVFFRPDPADDKPPQASGHDGLAATATIEATLLSLQHGRAVKLAEVPGE
jgi:hypothetical protein